MDGRRGGAEATLREGMRLRGPGIRSLAGGGRGPSSSGQNSGRDLLWRALNVDLGQVRRGAVGKCIEERSGVGAEVGRAVGLPANTAADKQRLAGQQRGWLQAKASAGSEDDQGRQGANRSGTGLWACGEAGQVPGLGVGKRGH